MVLAVLCAALAVYVVRRDAGVARDPGSTRPLLSAEQLPVDRVQRVTLDRRGEGRFVFERDVGGASGGAWMQVEPFHHPMDAFAMRQFISAAAAVQVFETLPADELAAEMVSLAPPDALVTFEWPDGEIAIELGRRGIAGRAYVRHGGRERIYVVSQELHHRAMVSDPKEMRDRAIFRNVGVESDRIEREEASGARLVLERDRRRWRMLDPAATRIDPAALDEFMQALGAARAAGFLVDQPADIGRFGLEPPAAVLTVLRDEEQQRLLVGSPAGGPRPGQDRFALVEGRPTIVRLPGAAVHALFRPASGLIDPTGSGAQPADVKAITIRGEHGELRIERDLERWRSAMHERRDVPAAIVNELLAQLTELRAADVRIQPYPHEIEVATITLIGFDERPLDTVRIARDPNTRVWALENGDGVLRLFPDSMTFALRLEDFGLR
jgi:hypothetical protein